MTVILHKDRKEVLVGVVDIEDVEEKGVATLCNHLKSLKAVVNNKLALLKKLVSLKTVFEGKNGGEDPFIRDSHKLGVKADGELLLLSLEADCSKLIVIVRKNLVVSLLEERALGD